MRRLLFIVSILLFTISCTKEDDQTIGDYSKYIKGDSIAYKIEFFPVEIYAKSTVDTADMKLFIKTQSSFGCINFGIAVDRFIANNTLIIRFDHIIQSNICLTAIGPATTYSELPESIDSIILINGHSIDRYFVNVTKEFIAIKPIKISFSQLTQDRAKIFRFPENTFSYESEMSLNETNIFNEFLKILTDNLAITEFTFTGDGYKPYGQNHTEHNRQSLNKYFHYENELEFDRAGELLKNFVISKGLNKNTSAYISLTSWNNKKYLSWMMHK
jgi:hypothetical protein